MAIEDVIVENVRINAEYWHPNPWANLNFITLRPTVNKYMRNQVPGRIKNIAFKDISIMGKEQEDGYSIWIKGSDEDHKVTDVSFENVNIFGKRLSRESHRVLIEENAESIRF